MIFPNEFKNRTSAIDYMSVEHGISVHSGEATSMRADARQPTPMRELYKVRCESGKTEEDAKCRGAES